MNKACKLNVEYKTTVDCVTLQYADTNEDIGLELVANGLVIVDERKERRLSGLVSKYVKAQEKAKASRVSLYNLYAFAYGRVSRRFTQL